MSDNEPSKKEWNWRTDRIPNEPSVISFEYKGFRCMYSPCGMLEVVGHPNGIRTTFPSVYTEAIKEGERLLSLAIEERKDKIEQAKNGFEGLLKSMIPINVELQHMSQYDPRDISLTYKTDGADGKPVEVYIRIELDLNVSSPRKWKAWVTGSPMVMYKEVESAIGKANELMQTKMAQGLKEVAMAWESYQDHTWLKSKMVEMGWKVIPEEWDTGIFRRGWEHSKLYEMGVKGYRDLPNSLRIHVVAETIGLPDGPKEVKYKTVQVIQTGSATPGYVDQATMDQIMAVLGNKQE